ncbi:hypothetical protein INS90_01840 [Trueperella pecoris]|uniref:Uncharacterized protein n=1 Tax=Trueperella pecoris TaxID=2733571 RepID=A0A7M1R1M7_9ACTO|nr:hypothetical protein [Trueperella pecoris]QOR48063.1 hypothetical protein INS90_01840 [Trueperella pecoris]
MMRDGDVFEGIPWANLALLGSAGLTTKTACQIRGMSPQKASGAPTQLKEAGIMGTRSIARGTQAYIALDVLDLVRHAERALVPTRFDARVSPPNRPVLERPFDTR